MLRRFTPILALVCGLATLPVLAAGQDAVPSPAEVLGYGIGERFTDYHGVREYVRVLAEASPQAELRVYGTTPQHRELLQLVVARSHHLQRLDEILARNRELLYPETSAARAAEIARTNPGVVYFSYGVHGNESSSPEAAMWTAWDLVREASGLEGVLDSLVVVIDPNSNPDGRERYVQWFRQTTGGTPNVSPQSREHWEPWPGGRFNHYLFDLNRDWAWATQPETQARLATWGSWNPQVHVDFHEMGFESTYFFFPAVDPINPIYPDFILDWGRRFGEGNAAAFDDRGWPYFTEESFDLFYPGYGDSWPSLVGAVGMTYEQAGHGRAGLAIERSWGDTLTLAQRAEQHRIAGHATLRTAAFGKTAMLEEFARDQRAIGRGEPDVLLVAGSDPTALDALADHLLRQGIEVERASRSFRTRASAYPGYASRSDFPEGTLRVRARQPRGRLATTLLQPETELRAEYSYDISAWSLPYAYGVEAHRVSGATNAAWQRVQSVGPQGREGVAPPALGYLVAPGDAAAAAVIRFLAEGGRAGVLTREATFEGRAWPAGTWFLPAARNPDLQRRAGEAGLGGHAVPVARGLSEEGIDLGSNRVRPATLPRVATLSGEGISATSFGSLWFYLEQEVEMPHDALWASDLERLDLSQYDVIVMPEGGGRAFTDQGRDALQGWVEAGGRLVAFGSGASTVAGWWDIARREISPSEGDERERFLRGRRDREADAWYGNVPGTVLPARMDPAHPLAWGAGAPAENGDIFLLHRGTLVFEPAAGVETAIHFPGELQRISGMISQENLAHLSEGSWAITKRQGQGSVVLFAGDPLFRLIWRSTHPVFLNAVLLGPDF
jgi:hypothetical protein